MYESLRAILRSRTFEHPPGLQPVSRLRACLGLVVALLAAAPVRADETRPRVAIRQGVPARRPGWRDAQAYRGVPYARPPVGPLRWRAPIPAGGLDRRARRFGVRKRLPAAPATAERPLFRRPRPPMSEACSDPERLGSGGAKGLPVMVWIHGGALPGRRQLWSRSATASSWRGGGSLWSRSTTACRPPGLLGPTRRSARGRTQHLSGNYGLLDQIEALRWVR
ncbi:carboxylesterase family protein [Caulobacter segnis]